MKKTIIILVAVVALIILTLLLFVPRGRQFSQSTRYADAKPSECLTRDDKQLVMSVRVGWHVSDAAAFTESFPGDSIALAQRQLDSMIYRADAEVVGLHNISDFVNPGGSETTLSKIEKELQSVIEGKLDKNSGILIESLSISSAKQR